MTKLPERNILDGSKLPKTTTGEMKGALGELRDYLNELLGEDSSDKETARLTLGIDLRELDNRIGAKAGQEALQAKADRSELESGLLALQEEIGRRSVPVGAIGYFALTTPPAGFLKADGSAVGRKTYPELFDAIGTVFGEGDGKTTFNLPDLMGRFPEGSTIPGTVKAAGLPNITGTVGVGDTTWAYGGEAGAFWSVPHSGPSYVSNATTGSNNAFGAYFDAGRSHPVYGASNTVQPPALTLLPCIKAFDALADPGLLDVGQLAQNVTGKLGKAVAGTPVKYVTDADDVGTSWYRKWSDGWLEQGGQAHAGNTSAGTLHPLQASYADTGYTLILSPVVAVTDASIYAVRELERSTTSFRSLGVCGNMDGFGYANLAFNWYACGRGTSR